MGLRAIAAMVVMALGVVSACGSDEGVTEAPDLGSEFVARYDAFRRASISYEERISRVVGDTALPEAPVTVIQSFPERVTIGEHQITGRVDGHSIGCNDASGTMTCIDNGVVDVEGDAVADIDEVVESVTGPTPTLWATAGESDDCYELTPVGAGLEGPWGNRAVLCFDPASELLASEVVDFDRGRQTVERTIVDDAVDRGDIVAAFPAVG